MGLPEDAFVVGMVGRISFQKDPATFIETARIIASRISSARFVWVGDGDMRDDLMRKAGAAGIADKVLVTGQQDRGKIPSLLAAMNVLLFTSRFEGLPIVLLEAMAAKRFIVAANVGSIMDIIQNNITGWLFTPGDCRRAAQIVCDIQANENIFSGIREAAFRLVSEEYSPAEKLGIQFHQVYSSLVARS
jgi:glycosyltransferase involved in cell wall biosynthesis